MPYIRIHNSLTKGRGQNLYGLSLLNHVPTWNCQQPKIKIKYRCKDRRMYGTLSGVPKLSTDDTFNLYKVYTRLEFIMQPKLIIRNYRILCSFIMVGLLLTYLWKTVRSGVPSVLSLFPSIQSVKSSAVLMAVVRSTPVSDLHLMATWSFSLRLTYNCEPYELLRILWSKRFLIRSLFASNVLFLQNLHLVV